MLFKRSHFMFVSIGLTAATLGTACDPVMIDHGAGGSAGTGGSSSSSSAASSSSGISSGQGGASVGCDPMNLPPEGSPCAVEGESCSPGCEDPCQFCNIRVCSGGRWTNIEAFPAECLSCDDVCPHVVVAQCAGGPPDQMTCVDGCMQNQMNECRVFFNQMLACIGPMPAFACDDLTRPTVAGCEAQFEKLYACIMP